MSNFTYEIDERNLRLRMKDFTIPVKEDAWQKFEAFADSSDSPSRETGIKFNFSLNRSVILPSIFGVVIILFSFLLVNFVSIKSPAASLKEQKAGISTATDPALQNEPKEKPAPVIQQEAQPVVETQKAAVIEDIKPEEKAMINALVAEPSPEEAQKLSNEQSNSDSVASAATEDEERAKRRAARRAARAEAKKLEEIKPTPVYEEHDVEEVRPN